MRSQLDKLTGEVGLLAFKVDGLAEALTGSASATLTHVSALLNGARDQLEQLYRRTDHAAPALKVAPRPRSLLEITAPSRRTPVVCLEPKPRLDPVRQAMDAALLAERAAREAARHVPPATLFAEAVARGRAAGVSMTNRRRAAFLEKFAEAGSIRLAAKASGFSIFVHYHAMRVDPTYAQVFNRVREQRLRAERANAASNRRARVERVADRSEALARAERLRRAFLDAYDRTGSVCKAARAAGIGHQRHAKWFRTRPDYRAAFEALRESYVGKAGAQPRRRNENKVSA